MSIITFVYSYREEKYDVVETEMVATRSTTVNPTAAVVNPKAAAVNPKAAAVNDNDGINGGNLYHTG